MGNKVNIRILLLGIEKYKISGIFGSSSAISILVIMYTNQPWAKIQRCPHGYILYVGLENQRSRAY